MDFLAAYMDPSPKMFGLSDQTLEPMTDTLHIF